MMFPVWRDFPRYRALGRRSREAVDEVAKIIYVLCTETSSDVNGAEIHIDGGQHV